MATISEKIQLMVDEVLLSTDPAHAIIREEMADGNVWKIVVTYNPDTELITAKAQVRG